MNNTMNTAVILPTKFPQLFVGKRKPWKGMQHLKQFVAMHETSALLTICTVQGVAFCYDGPCSLNVVIHTVYININRHSALRSAWYR